MILIVKNTTSQDILTSHSQVENISVEDIACGQQLGVIQGLLISIVQNVLSFMWYSLVNTKRSDETVNCLSRIGCYDNLTSNIGKGTVNHHLHGRMEPETNYYFLLLLLVIKSNAL